MHSSSNDQLIGDSEGGQSLSGYALARLQYGGKSSSGFHVGQTAEGSSGLCHGESAFSTSSSAVPVPAAPPGLAADDLARAFGKARVSADGTVPLRTQGPGSYSANAPMGSLQAGIVDVTAPSPLSNGVGQHMEEDHFDDEQQQGVQQQQSSMANRPYADALRPASGGSSTTAASSTVNSNTVTPQIRTPQRSPPSSSPQLSGERPSAVPTSVNAPIRVPSPRFQIPEGGAAATSVWGNPRASGGGGGGFAVPVVPFMDASTATPLPGVWDGVGMTDEPWSNMSLGSAASAPRGGRGRGRGRGGGGLGRRGGGGNGRR